MNTIESRDIRRRESVASSGTVHRVIRLIQCLIEAEGAIGITEMRKPLHLPIATLHRLLGLLAETGVVEGKQSGRRYRPGGELIRLANLLQSQQNAERPVMDTLSIVAEEAGGVAMFCRYLPIEGAMTYAHKVCTVRAKHIGPELLKPGPIAWGASGHAVLAWLSEVEQNALIRRAGPSPVKGTPVNGEELRHIIGDVRKRGYAISFGDRLPSEVGIAAPIFGSAGSVVGSLCVTKPQMFFNPKTGPRVAEIVRKHALHLSQEFRSLQSG